MGWTKQELDTIEDADDFRIAPLREDGVTTGTPTFIWSVVAEGALYVRAYSGTESSWYRAALRERAGRISVAGMTREVTFSPAEPELNDRIDAAYRAKYVSSRYLAPMVSDRARAATVRVDADDND
ncbi:MAG: DUF2255 domain-containing protein [Rhodobacteraceae bacterium]|jgi:hypothetical protein|uniref:Uncharacterized protein n=1 Tax=Salipiger profundus TaxID=1229727 RepID=A0A1U7D9S3_9RHOB|nr:MULTISPECIES: DUF2255 family protein [Salipiger]APX24911.1 hypothetical protein Ga0080559_TMP4115 [Salipiger profundus]MAB07824.1 DUF2255 domain-containing protein [Paracoccaceae bacterium]GFZ98779.1 hypothetical protein GCM10011326_07680 [Salipiger profundus]SFC95342.1 hypothetical protein SAMN05444415_10681 [Salipiger profundus]